MRDVEARLLHRRQHGFRRRRRGREEFDDVGQGLLLVRGRIEQSRHHDRRAAQMRHLVIGDGVVHRRRPHRAQAHMRAGDDGNRPGKAPAVAVKHRQRPQIHRVLAHRAGHDVADGEQMRAAVMIDHAFRIAGGARRVVERDRVPFVARHFPGVGRIALRDEFLVFDGADPLAGAGKLLVVIIDDQRLHLGERQRLFHHFGKFAVDDHDLGVGMVEREGEDRGIEPRVQRIEHALAHRHAVMALEHGRRIGEQRRHRVAAPDAALGQRRGEPARACIELAVAAPQRRRG